MADEIETENGGCISCGWHEHLTKFRIKWITNDPADFDNCPREFGRCPSEFVSTMCSACLEGFKAWCGDGKAFVKGSTSTAVDVIIDRTSAFMTEEQRLDANDRFWSRRRV